MKNRKLIVYVNLFCAILFLLTGCNKMNGQNETTAKVSTSGSADTIKFAVAWFNRNGSI